MTPDNPNASIPSASASSFRLAGRYLLALPQSDDVPARWRHAGKWFLFWGVLFGLSYQFVYWFTWSLFGEYEKIRLVPCVCVLALDQLLFGRRLTAGLTSWAVPSGNDRDEAMQRRQVLLVMALLLKLALLVYIPVGRDYGYSGASWRQALAVWLPAPVYFPLLLMPMWGRWTMTLAMTMGPVTPEGTSRLRGLVEGARLRSTLGIFALATLVTLLLACPTAEDLPLGILLIVGTLAWAYAASFAIIRLQRGLTEHALDAVGALAEIGFLAAYLPVARHIYQY